ncbi:MAG: LysM peptidoglycan-binding domain-containing protein [Luteolibacter sp.]
MILGCALMIGGMALGDETYTIKPGDNLTRIARKHGCTVAELIKANGLKSNAMIHPGQKLKIPDGKEAAQVAPTEAAGTYTVKPGDTFSSIARRHDISVKDLMTANPDTDPKALRPGKKIKLGTPQELATQTAGETVSAAPAGTESALPAEKPAIVTVAVDAEMTYSAFATKHDTDIARLNELNGLDLDASTLLAKGSELYVPQAPPAERKEP